MRVIGMMLAITPVIAWGQVSVEDAGRAAREVPLPAFESYLTEATVKNTLPPTSVGDTSSLSVLRGEDGMGEIREPGLAKAIACDTRNDPECLAIQMLRYGAANRPRFDDETSTAIREGLGALYEQTDTTLGDLASLSSLERVCENVETTVPGQSTSHVCDITTLNDSDRLCEEGWKASTSLQVLYACQQKAASITNACEVTTRALTHEEDRMQCIDRAAVAEDRACTVPANVKVTKTYPYTCPITKAAETKKKCVKTLTVGVTPKCTSAVTLPDISISPWKNDLGWNGNSRYSAFSLSLACSNTFSLTITLGSRLARPQYTATLTNINGTAQLVTSSHTINGKTATFKITAKQVWVDNIDHIQVTITNVDNGNGVRTSTSALTQWWKPSITQRDVWSETCEVVK